MLRNRPRSDAGRPGLEVLLMTRPATSSFAPGAEVFPGGSIDAADSDPGWLELDPDRKVIPEAELPLRVTAVRETFEECGVLLARDGRGSPCRAQLAAELAPLRSRLQGGRPHEFLGGLRETGLRPGWEDLLFCAHWVTPEGLPLIFDTRFFLAALPPGQEPSRDDLGELESMRWVKPATALQEAVQGQTLLLPPTRAVLEQLAGSSTVAGALRAARNSAVERIQPKLAEVTSSHYPGLDVPAIRGWARKAEE